MAALLFLVLAIGLHMMGGPFGSKPYHPAQSLALFAYLTAGYFFIRNPFAVLGFITSLSPPPKLNVPKPRSSSNPPTQEERKRASEHLRAAWAMIDELPAKPDNRSQLFHLEHVAMAVAKARALDLQAQFQYQDKTGELVRVTADDVASRALYIESDLYLKQAEASSTNAINSIGIDKWDVKQHKKDEQKELQLALSAIDKALTYTNYSSYHLHRATVLNRLGRTKDAKAALDRAYQLAPDDIEVLKMRALWND